MWGSTASDSEATFPLLPLCALVCACLPQVILSLTLSFAVVPLVHLTSKRSLMGEHVNSWPTTIIAAAVVFVIAGLNIFLVVQAAIDA